MTDMELLARMIVYLANLVIFVPQDQRMASPAQLVTSVRKAASLRLYDALLEPIIAALAPATQLDVDLVPADTSVVHQLKTFGDQQLLMAV